MTDDRDDAALKQEIDRIAKRIESIMEKVDALYPPQPPGDSAGAPSEPEPVDESGAPPPTDGISAEIFR